jgi:hypothetical protein
MINTSKRIMKESFDPDQYTNIFDDDDPLEAIPVRRGQPNRIESNNTPAAAKHYAFINDLALTSEDPPPRRCINLSSSKSRAKNHMPAQSPTMEILLQGVEHKEEAVTTVEEETQQAGADATPAVRDKTPKLYQQTKQDPGL